ncbi:MAG: glycoside hydrolase family 15 protein, partial [Bdellovibrionia bacterium]
FQSQQAYLQDTNILQTSFECKSGRAVLTDLFPVKDIESHPNEFWPDEEILRILEVREGSIEFTLELLLRSQYGRCGLQLYRISDWGIKCDDGRKHFLLQTSLPNSTLKLSDTPLGQQVNARFELRDGDRIFISLSYSDEAPSVMPPLQCALDRLHHTVSYWQNWSALCPCQGPYRKIIQRSALALKLLNFAPSGAVVAAPTTSLPEWIGGSRNWDYRFCWLRDASFTTRALMRVGHYDEAKSFLQWLIQTTRLTWPRLQVLYNVYGEAKIRESRATWASGFRNSKPVRLGNLASTQLQLDVYGEVIDSFYHLAEYIEPIDHETQKMVIGFGTAVAQLWEQPDQGIWEFRTNPKHYTHSKVMCWVAMDRLSKLARRLNWRLPYNPGALAIKIRHTIESRAYHPLLNVYTRALNEPELDASLLVMPLVGYCEANEPRYLATQTQIIHQLGKNGLIYRYPQGSDGFSEPEGAFTLCNFWLAEAFAKAGNLGEAEKWFNAVSCCLPPSGLSSEELNPENREYLGNHPQGFSHIGLINAALAIEELLEKKGKIPT